MKKMKKLLSLVLTVAMVVAMGVTVFADAPTTKYKISTKDGDGHTYNVYQIFTADTVKNANKETVQISNIKWGKNAKDQTEGEKVDEDTVTTIKNISGTDQQKADAISAYVDLNSTAVGSVSAGKSLPVPTGYYLIKDATAVTTYLVKVVDEDIEIARKTDVPSSAKKVKDVNDSTGATTDWQDSADYDIGDAVPFQLTGTVASNYDSYKTYKFVFHDKESKGLTFNEGSVKVYVDGNEITTGYTVKTPGTHQDTFDVTFDDLKNIKSVHAGSVITVEYTSTLNDKAVIGSEGNPNTMHLEFSNNPNDVQGGETGTTPDDTVIVFTYDTVINKVDETGKKRLTGAEFILEKKINGKNGADTWKEITAVKSNEGTTFTFSGLDDGEYRLRETQAPPTYNAIDDITFIITAKHDVLSDNPALTELNCNKLTFTPNKDEGSLTANIVNKKGSTLPSTGGIGTTIFYVIGGILMVGAGVILVSRRRRSK